MKQVRVLIILLTCFVGVSGFVFHLNAASASSVRSVGGINNTPPVAVNDTYQAEVNTPLSIPATGVLSNDSDEDERLYTVSGGGNDDQLRIVDPYSATTMAAITMTLAGFTVERGLGLATHPQTGELYAILRLNGQTGRQLVMINPATGVATNIGNLGDQFAGITFATDGTLYGVTGDGATISETLFIIDTETATPTLLLPLGNGDDGETIAYNPDDGLLYHASGHSGPCTSNDLSSCVVFEKIDLTPPYTITNIPISDTALINEEAQALVYWPAISGFLWKQNHGIGPLFQVTIVQTPTLIGEMDHQAKGLAFAGDPLTAVLDDAPAMGDLVLNPDGSFVYTPTLDFVGTITFTYHANDRWSDSNVATVTIHVGVRYLYLPVILKP
ncbi:MAG TPA: Ig-like domain-containing protein [Chloroflexota bacterium]|nr:Ig-like domain-containing protein [Chloroflexota bacterium]